jgi:hypothetical protein
MRRDPSDRPSEHGALGPPGGPPSTAVGTLTPPPPRGPGRRTTAGRRVPIALWYAYAAAPLATGLPLAHAFDSVTLRLVGLTLAGSGVVALGAVFALLHGGRWFGGWRAPPLARRHLRPIASDLSNS